MIQNELIQLCGDYIHKSLVKDCNRAPFYAFLADEATDAATMEQISMCPQGEGGVSRIRTGRKHKRSGID